MGNVGIISDLLNISFNNTSMHDLVIPSWAVVLGGGVVPVIITWLIWLTLRSNDNATKIAVNISESENLSKQLEGIKESITNARVEFKVSFDKLENKFDTFLSGELHFFKEQYSNKKHE